MDVREQNDMPFLGQQMAQQRTVSDATAQKIDKAVRDILEEAETRARKAIEDNRDAFRTLTDRLFEEETLDRPEIEECLGPRPADAEAGGGTHTRKEDA